MIIQHAVFNIVAPILHGTMTIDEYAAIPGRGTHRCSMNVRRDMKEEPWRTRYCLKMDIHHYFDNIDRNILFEMIKRKIKCRRTLDLLYTIIFDAPGTKGLPIGLYSSQILSVFYLSELDHYCKEVLGIKYYYRYMDDIVILESNKNLLHNYLRLIKRFLTKYKLELKHNYAIFPVEKRRLDFVGFVHNHDSAMIRKKTKLSYIKVCNNQIHRIKHHIPITRHIVDSRRSYEGIIGWSTDDSLLDKYSNKADMYIDFGDLIS